MAQLLTSRTATRPHRGAIRRSSRGRGRCRATTTGGPADTENLDGYFGYYGANATDAGGKSYYSYDIAGSNWHVVNLDSECQLVPGGCAAGSAQEMWLEADLAANSSKNVIAMWHKPRYSSGATNYQALQPLWDDLYAAGVDILLDGHDHIYERFAPMKSGATLADPPSADADLRDPPVHCGTGGEAHHGLATTLPTSEIRNDTNLRHLQADPAHHDLRLGVPADRRQHVHRLGHGLRPWSSRDACRGLPPSERPLPATPRRR